MIMESGFFLQSLQNIYTAQSTYYPTGTRADSQGAKGQEREADHLHLV
jgi:hypothetical protein